MKPKQPAKRSVGRPATITLSVAEAIATRMALGMSEENACLDVGANYQTWTSACKRHPEYALVKKRGMARFQFKALSSIAAGTQNWTGLAWILERRHGPEFRRPSPEVQLSNTNQYVMGFTEAEWKEVVMLAQRGPEK